MRVLLLGGTTEATALAHAFADKGIDAVFSYAGRTANPVEQPLPTRLGGYGGVKGLANYVIDAQITHIVDATHPFATQISRNAVEASALTDTPLLAHERPAWRAQPGDTWVHVADTQAAVAALPAKPARIFLAIGKQTLPAFASRPDHFYLLRLVDAPDAALPMPNAEVVLDRGPFTLESDMELMRAHAITHIVAKNSGGSGALAKLEAARRLHLPVILIARPAIADRPMARSIPDVLDWLDHSARLGV